MFYLGQRVIKQGFFHVFLQLFDNNYFYNHEIYLKIIVGGGYFKRVPFKTESRTTKTTEEIMKTSSMGPWADGKPKEPRIQSTQN